MIPFIALLVPITILIILAAAMAVDLFPLWKTWLDRIHIGRYTDTAGWATAVTAVGARWLHRTPLIPVTDQTRWTIIERWRGTYARRSIQVWQEAALLLGIQATLRGHEDAALRLKLDKYLRANLNQGGWKRKPEHIDAALLAYAFLKMDDGRACRQACDDTWALIRAHIGMDGTVQYRKTMPDYRYVDTIGFICPFLVAYGVKYGKDACITLAIQQLRAYVRHGLLKEYGIPCHAYAVEEHVPLGLYGWGRGLGWYAIGLAGVWNELPERHPFQSELRDMMERFARTCLMFQQQNGSWNWTVTRQEIWPDSSTTAVLGWFLAQAAALPLQPALSERCLHSAKRAVRYLMTVTRRDGAIDFSQGDTKDIGVYAMRFHVLPFTQGFAMQLVHALAEIDEDRLTGTGRANAREG